MATAGKRKVDGSRLWQIIDDLKDQNAKLTHQLRLLMEENAKLAVENYKLKRPPTETMWDEGPTSAATTR